jgi:hypothetical protein
MPNKLYRQCGKQESVTDRFKNQSVSLEKSDMNAEQDAWEIWEKASENGRQKYTKGQTEHNTQFWTGGAGWYAKSLREEQLDSISYGHHLMERIQSIQTLAEMMEEGEVSLRDAATILKELVSSNPPKPYAHQSND